MRLRLIESERETERDGLRERALPSRPLAFASINRPAGALSGTTDKLSGRRKAFLADLQM